MVRSRRPILVLLLLLTAIPAAADGSAAVAPVVVVASVEVDAHRLAIEGIQAALATPCEMHVVDVGQARRKFAAGTRLTVPGVHVIIAVGSESAQVIASERPEVPVICTMILRRNTQGDAAAVTISLDVSLPSLLARLKQIFPGKTRCGIIRNPALGGAQLQARAQQQGFTVHVVDCSGSDQLLAALASLKGQVDFVWCLPDGTLYNGVTIKPLILASVENRLPLIGFSESFARAGAAVAVYPDFRDIGVQTGEAARQILEGHAVRSSEGPRRLRVALNQSVLRLLGLRWAPAAAEEVSVLP
jgi:putative ABC transport system substrate-binding protein